MKFKLFLLSILTVISFSCTAQSFFKPLPRPSHSVGKFGLAADSISNSFRPLIGVSATIMSDGSTLAGGFGAGFNHAKFDYASQSWITQYSISGLVFLDSKTSVTGGILFGLANGIFQIGPGYNFTTKQFAVLTGIGIKPF